MKYRQLPRLAVCWISRGKSVVIAGYICHDDKRKSIQRIIYAYTWRDDASTHTQTARIVLKDRTVILRGWMMYCEHAPERIEIRPEAVQRERSMSEYMLDPDAGADAYVIHKTNGGTSRVNCEVRYVPHSMEDDSAIRNAAR